MYKEAKIYLKKKSAEYWELLQEGHTNILNRVQLT